ncbi:MAG: CPBP family intramembrane metalloprotease [Planctomycetes bacterium]|nr:CPBP family intramembrane metalloprotease [Planctomycetota bacterium]
MSGAIFVFFAFVATASLAMELLGAGEAEGSHKIELALAGQSIGVVIALALAVVWRRRPFASPHAPLLPAPQAPWFTVRGWRVLRFCLCSWLVFLCAWVPLLVFGLTAVWRAFGWPMEAQPHLTYFATPSATPWFASAALAVVVLGPILEEVVFRGFLHDGLRARLGPRATITVVAVLFGAMHVGDGGVLFVPTALLGALFGWLRERSGGLFAPIATHMLHNGATVALVVVSPSLVDWISRG